MIRKEYQGLLDKVKERDDETYGSEIPEIPETDKASKFSKIAFKQEPE